MSLQSLGGYLGEYLRNKTESRRFVNYLLGTANRLDHTLLDAFPGAREALLQPVNYNSIEYVVARPLPSNGYLAIAKAISESNCKVPAWVLPLSRSILAVRRKLTTRWQNSKIQAESVCEATKRHAHFNDVLAETIRILGLQSPPLTVDTQLWTLSLDGSQDSSTEDTKHLRDEDARILDLTPESSDVVNSSLHSDVVPGSCETEFDDTLMALEEFFGLLEEVRAYLTKVWTEYRDGRLSLINASMITNIAFEIIRFEESVLADLFPKISDYLKIAEHLSVDLPEFEYILQGAELRKSVLPFMDIFLILRQSTLTAKLRDKAGNPRSWLGSKLWQIPDRPAESAYLKSDSRRDGRYYLRDLLLELWLFHVSPDTRNVKIWLPDAITSGILAMFQKKAIPVWLVFACRVYLDIRCTIGPLTVFYQHIVSLEMKLAWSLFRFIATFKRN